MKRPLDPRFSLAVRAYIKITTIRDKPWPVGVPITLYNWSGKPYASKHQDVETVVVKKTTPIRIYRSDDGDCMVYVPAEDILEGYARMLWATEGFGSSEEMDEWFKKAVKPGESIQKHLMLFEVQERKGGLN